MEVNTHQQHILDTLIKLNVPYDVNTPYADIINNLPDATIAALFKLTWNACAPNGFSSHYNLNNNDFYQYSLGKKQSNKSRAAICDFLLHGIPENMRKSVAVKSALAKNEQQNLAVMDELEDDNTFGPYPTNVIHSQIEMRKILISKFMNDAINTLVIIDGDHNSVRTMNALNSIDDKHIHIVRVMSRGSGINSKLFGLDRLTFLRSATITKDAADTSITFLSAKLSSILLSLKIKVILVSKDGFMVELLQLLQNEGIQAVLVRNLDISISDLKTILYN